MGQHAEGNKAARGSRMKDGSSQGERREMNGSPAAVKQQPPQFRSGSRVKLIWGISTVILRAQIFFSRLRGI
jgi:hypothetical protein